MVYHFAAGCGQWYPSGKERAIRTLSSCQQGHFSSLGHHLPAPIPPPPANKILNNRVLLQRPHSVMILSFYLVKVSQCTSSLSLANVPLGPILSLPHCFPPLHPAPVIVYHHCPRQKNLGSLHWQFFSVCFSTGSCTEHMAQV